MNFLIIVKTKFVKKRLTKGGKLYIIIYKYKLAL